MTPLIVASAMATALAPLSQGTLGPTPAAFGLGLTLASALSWATLDLLRKQLITRVGTWSLVVWLAACQLPALGLAAWSAPWTPIGADYLGWLGLGIVLNIAANFLYLGAIARGQFSVAIPLLAFVPVWTTVFGIPLLDQWPSLFQGIGIAIVVMGALILHGGVNRHRLRALVHEPSSLMMLGVSLCWSLTIAVDRRATSVAPVALHAFNLNLGIAVATTAWMAATGRLSQLGEIRRAPWRVSVAGLVAACALGLQLWAIQGVFISVVEAIKRTVGMAGALIFGRWSFGEPIPPSKLLGVVLMTLGSVLVTGAAG